MAPTTTPERASRPRTAHSQGESRGGDSTKEPQQTLRANNATIKCILDTLDAKEIPSNEPQEPDDHRYSYRVPALRVELQQTNGSVAHVIVPTRKIGRDGVSFLVGRLVYPETSCRIDLITTHNHWQSVTGKVVGCKYVQGTGSIYEADVHFQQPIDIALFVAQALRVRVLLVNIFAGITDLGEFARLLTEAFARTPQLKVPIVARLVGTGLEAAREFLAARNITLVTDLGAALVHVRRHLGSGRT